MSPDVVASIKARLLNQARKLEEEFQLYLVRYACERFLYRLGASPVRERCVVKGAALLTLWMPDPYRKTRDLDLGAAGMNDEASLRGLIADVCAVECPEDGLVFDLGSLAVSPIRVEEENAGQRARLTARLGKAQIRFQVDFGFGDAVTPPPEEREFPTLLPGLPAPLVRAYRREVSIAEKFDAMVKLGRRNSRMKDFHDVWALSSKFAFEGPVLREALVACFERRRAPWTENPPDVLRSAFYQDGQPRAAWANYLTTGAFLHAPPTRFETIGERVLAFLGPVRESIVADTEFEVQWPAGGPWQSGTGQRERGEVNV